MRPTFSSMAVLASSLLAREVFAAPHMHKHKRDVVTDVVLVTEEITVNEVADGIYETELPVAVATTTIDGTPVTISSTPAAASSSSSASSKEATSTSAQPTTSSSEASSVQAAVFIQNPNKTETKAPSKPATTAEPISTTAPAVPNTPAPVEPPTTLATTTSPSAPASTGSTSSSGKKRGLAYNDADLLSGFVSSNSQVGWCYNWASSTAKTPSGLEYVPLLWGTQDEYTSVWNANANAALAAGSTHLMGFNEPDYSGQSDLSVSAAVSGWMTHMQPFASKASLGAPAVTNGGAPMGLTYLGNFLSELKSAGGSHDFCSIHWYDSATNIDYFKSYMQDASAACNGKPIWITEFGASGSTAEQDTFLETVMPWMDEQSYIERYAYFMVATDNLISSGTTLSQLGNTFATFA